MRIKIRDIASSGLDLEQALDRGFLRDALEGADADLEQCRLHAQLHLDAVADNVIARGRLTGLVTVRCARCLGPAPMLIDLPLRMTFTPADLLPADDDITDDVEFSTHDGEWVLLEDLLRDAVILTVPMTPLCQPECKGICPVCGQDRNTLACTCNPHPPDPRLAALRHVKL